MGYPLDPTPEQRAKKLMITGNLDRINEIKYLRDMEPGGTA